MRVTWSSVLHWRSAKCTVEQLLIAEPMMEFAFDPRWDQVLPGAWVPCAASRPVMAGAGSEVDQSPV